MAFNLYFAGMQSPEAEQAIEQFNCKRLQSYFNDKRNIQKRVEKKLITFIDSGAFSAYTKGVTIDVDAYINYVNQYDEFIDIFAQLDVIPGEHGKQKTKEQLDAAPEQSWENYLYMLERVKSPNKLLPVFHYGEDFNHLVRMLEHTPKIEFLGLGGLASMGAATVAEKEVFINKCFETIKASSNPNVKTHALGMTSLHLLEQFPFYSADSTSWIKTAVYGGIMTRFGVLMLSEKLKHDLNHALNMPQNVLNELQKYIEKFGFTFEELSTNYKARTIFNIRYLKEWADNYQYKPKKVKQLKLF